VECSHSLTLFGQVLASLTQLYCISLLAAFISECKRVSCWFVERHEQILKLNLQLLYINLHNSLLFFLISVGELLKGD